MNKNTDTQYPHMFRPLEIRGRTLRNRVVFGAHTTNMAKDGLPGDQHHNYYLERALGGAAMIVVEPQPVHATAVLTNGNFRVDDDSVIPAFRRLTKACKAEGAVMIQQIYHIGQHGDSDLSFAPNWSPSGMPSYHDSDGSHAISETEIQELIAAFVRAAKRCQKAGFDGVEVWAAYHSLIEQFWRPWSNTRDDNWGGSLENRMRFGMEIVEQVRAACGEDFIIGLSVSTTENDPVALSRSDLSEIVLAHDATGYVDYVTCGSGSYIDYDTVMPTFVHPEKLTVDMTEMLMKRVQNAKIISESHIRTPDNANAVLGSGQADLVSIVRGQIADPHLVTKAAEGRPEDVRGCISCNQMCWGRRSRDYWISCLVNPSVGRETEWGGDRFTAAATPQNVVVVGAGPAGLEAVRVAAERGHRVTLYEASDKVGGQFRLAGLQPRRAQIIDLLDWYEHQLMCLRVKVQLNTFVESDELAEMGADQIILATGSLPAETGYQRWIPDRPHLDGLQNGKVFAPEDIMQRTVNPGHHVIVVDEGGHWRGAGTAWYLMEKGHKVTIITPDPYVGKELSPTTSDFALRKTLAKSGVFFFVESVVDSWSGTSARVVSLLTGQVRQIEADALVMATTNVAFDFLAKELDEKGISYHMIGDCVAPRRAPLAIYEGRQLGNVV